MEFDGPEKPALAVMYAHHLAVIMEEALWRIAERSEKQPIECDAHPRGAARAATDRAGAALV